MVIISQVISRPACTYLTLMVKNPDLKSMEGEAGFGIQKWRLYKGLEGSSGKKVHLGLKSV